MTARGILLDIEGTTTPISFVYEVLFPFARQHAAEYLKQAHHLSDLKREHDDDVRQGRRPPRWSTEPVNYFHWLMDQDRKSTALKDIQGRIWLRGYQNGDLRGQVFADVPPALERWHQREIDVCIFSSGSILSQRLLFSTSTAGDLAKFISGYFDTTTGLKDDPASYRQIANTFAIPASDILFISDVTRELDAAAQAGMQTLLCIRPNNPPQPAHSHGSITTFDQVE